MDHQLLHEHPLKDKNFKINCSYMPYNMDFALHFHEEVEIIYMEKGHLGLSLQDQWMTLEAGDLLVVGANQLHGYRPLDTWKEEERHYYMVIFNMEILSGLPMSGDLLALLFNGGLLRQQATEEREAFLKLFADLFEENRQDLVGNECLQLANLSQIIGRLLRAQPIREQAVYDLKVLQKEQALLKQVNHYIHKHYQEGLLLGQVAGALGYSDYHFSRQFKKVAGVSFKHYLNHYQLARAKVDVVTTNRMMTEIAFDHGFHSIKTFNRLFKAYYEMSPTAYRQQQHNKK